MTDHIEPRPTSTDRFLRPHRRKAFALTGAVLLLGACGDDGGATTIAEGTGELFGRTVELTATEDGDEVGGQAAVTSESEPSFTISFACKSEPVEDVVIVAGEVSESEDEERPVGTRAAVLLMDGDPTGLGMWFEDGAPAGSCDEFVEGIPTDAVSDPEAYVPVDDITLG